MAKEIVWTRRATNAYSKVIDYLLEEWSEREARNFIGLAETILNLIAKNPEAFRKLEKKNHHEALVTRHNLLIYEVRANKVFILTVWDTRRNPRKKKV